MRPFISFYAEGSWLPFKPLGDVQATYGARRKGIVKEHVFVERR